MRLYLDATLTSYVEVPEEAILDRRQGGTEESPLGRSTTLWVRRGTQLEHTVANSRHVQAEFLQGDITAANLAAEGGVRLGRSRGGLRPGNGGAAP